MDTISCKEARDKMAEVINKVVYSHKRYTLTRHGNQVAVIISFEDWQLIEKLLQRIEDEEDLLDAESAMERIKKEGGTPLEQLKKELSL